VAQQKVIETLNAALYPDAPSGSTSNGLALSEDEKHYMLPMPIITVLLCLMLVCPVRVNQKVLFRWVGILPMLK